MAIELCPALAVIRVDRRGGACFERVEAVREPESPPVPGFESDSVDGKIPYVFGLGRKTRRTLTLKLAIAFGAIALMVGTILLRGIPLPLAVVGHEGSTVLVSLNGLRLLGYRE